MVKVRQHKNLDSSISIILLVALILCNATWQPTPVRAAGCITINQMLSAALHTEIANSQTLTKINQLSLSGTFPLGYEVQVILTALNNQTTILTQTTRVTKTNLLIIDVQSIPLETWGKTSSNKIEVRHACGSDRFLFQLQKEMLQLDAGAWRLTRSY